MITASMSKPCCSRCVAAFSRTCPSLSPFLAFAVLRDRAAIRTLEHGSCCKTLQGRHPWRWWCPMLLYGLQQQVGRACTCCCARATMHCPSNATVSPASDAARAGHCMGYSSLAGVARPVVSGTSWPGCIRPGVSLAWWGRRCVGKPQLTEWMGVYAIDTETGARVEACTRERGSNAAENELWLGSCGTAPKVSPNTPVDSCMPSPGGRHGWSHLMHHVCSHAAAAVGCAECCCIEDCSACLACLPLLTGSPVLLPNRQLLAVSTSWHVLLRGDDGASQP